MRDYTMFLLGLGAGLALFFLVAYVPMRTWYRLTKQNRSDIARILGGFQAKTAHMPVYPGNTGKRDDPDPAWVAWLAETGIDYWAPRTVRAPNKQPVPKFRTQALLVLVTLLWAAGRRPRPYPWWQRAADWVWEATFPLQSWYVRTRNEVYSRWLALTVPVPAQPRPRVLRVKRHYSTP